MFLDFYNLIQDLKIKNIKEICNSFMAYFHFNNKIYNTLFFEKFLSLELLSSVFKVLLINILLDLP